MHDLAAAHSSADNPLRLDRHRSRCLDEITLLHGSDSTQSLMVTLNYGHATSHKIPICTQKQKTSPNKYRKEKEENLQTYQIRETLALSLISLRTLLALITEKCAICFFEEIQAKTAAPLGLNAFRICKLDMNMNFGFDSRSQYYVLLSSQAHIREKLSYNGSCKMIALFRTCRGFSIRLTSLSSIFEVFLPHCVFFPQHI